MQLLLCLGTVPQICQSLACHSHHSLIARWSNIHHIPMTSHGRCQFIILCQHSQQRCSTSWQLQITETGHSKVSQQLLLKVVQKEERSPLQHITISGGSSVQLL